MSKGVTGLILKNKSIFAVTAAVCLMAGTAVISSAFWTDMISLDQEVSSMTIGISYDSDSLGLDNAEPYLPGDSREFGFKVINSGDISVDIKPVMTISATNDMVKGASEFIITDADGNEITDYTKTYYDKDDVVITSERINAGEKFRKAVYELTGEETLSGSRQKDASEGEETSELSCSYALKMSENTGNDFKNTTASLEVSTYAIQHRNRDTGDEWISIAAGA